MVNAVAHRDYSMQDAKIRLRLFADRLEIYSPGTIPNTITVDSLAYRQAARNETITSLLAKCGVPDEEGLQTGRTASPFPAVSQSIAWSITASCC